MHVVRDRYRATEEFLSPDAAPDQPPVREPGAASLRAELWADVSRSSTSEDLMQTHCLRAESTIGPKTSVCFQNFWIRPQAQVPYFTNKP